MLHTQLHTHRDTHMHASVGKCTLITPWRERRRKVEKRKAFSTPNFSISVSFFSYSYSSLCALAITLSLFAFHSLFCCLRCLCFFLLLVFFPSTVHSFPSLCLSFWRMIIEKQPAAAVASKNYWPLFARSQGGRGREGERGWFGRTCCRHAGCG